MRSEKDRREKLLFQLFGLCATLGGDYMKQDMEDYYSDDEVVKWLFDYDIRDNEE